MTKPLRREPGFEYMSFDDFQELLADKPEDEKWELINGRVIRGQVGARVEHHHIIGNLDFSITTHLRATDRPCRVYRETFYLRKRSDDLTALPDVMVRCGQVAAGLTSFDDPLVLIEVVSPGSVTRDRLEKRIAYQSLPSLQTYVIVERDRMLVDVYERTSGAFTDAKQLQRPTDRLLLPAIDFSMPLSEIYLDVTLTHTTG